jgi:hypothetical protein
MKKKIMMTQKRCPVDVVVVIIALSFNSSLLAVVIVLKCRAAVVVTTNSMFLRCIQTVTFDGGTKLRAVGELNMRRSQIQIERVDTINSDTNNNNILTSHPTATIHLLAFQLFSYNRKFTTEQPWLTYQTFTNQTA